MPAATACEMGCHCGSTRISTRAFSPICGHLWSRLTRQTVAEASPTAIDMDVLSISFNIRLNQSPITILTTPHPDMTRPRVQAVTRAVCYEIRRLGISWPPIHCVSFSPIPARTFTHSHCTYSHSRHDLSRELSTCSSPSDEFISVHHAHCRRV